MRWVGADPGTLWIATTKGDAEAANRVVGTQDTDIAGRIGFPQDISLRPVRAASGSTIDQQVINLHQPAADKPNTMPITMAER